MGKWQNDSLLDLGLDYIYNNCDMVYLCSEQPTTYTQASSTYALASAELSAADFVKADGVPNGRKLTVAEKTAITLIASGTGNHLALTSSGTSELLVVTTTPAVEVQLGGSVSNFESWIITFGDIT